MIKTLNLVCSFLLLTISLSPLAAATHQDDAGSGGDAPDAREDALPVEFGAWSGRLSGDEEDKADWYRLSLANLTPTQGLRVTFTANAWTYLDILWPSDFWWSTHTLASSDGRASTREFLAYGSHLDLRVGPSSAAYTIQVETFERPDLLAEDVRVAFRDVTTDAASLPLGTQRDVTFDLDNVGTGAPRGFTSVTVTAYHTVGSRVIASFQAPTLLPGQSATITVPWDGNGEIGDARVEVRVSTAFDQDPANDRAQTMSYVVLGNLGFGVDLLPP